jgi:serine protease Do
VPTEKVFSKATVSLLLVITLLLSFFAVYCIASDIVASKNEGSNTANNDKYVIQAGGKPASDSPTAELPNQPLTVAGVAKMVLPSIVEIRTFTSGRMPLASGSGIIISEDGLISTNAHVIENASSISVNTHDGKNYDAYVVGRDKKTDLAVLKITVTEPLPKAHIGKSEEVEIGEDVVAIGNPAGLVGSVTNGIVSAVNRPIRADMTGYDMNCIQTNAAISPGNSGGALLNMYGQVIGITSSKYVSDGYEGLGFAIAIDDALPILEDLITNGKVVDRVRIGITFIEYSDYEFKELIRERFRIEPPADVKGVLIQGISTECDIFDTDLREMDIITTMNGKEVLDLKSMLDALKGKKPGDTVEADVVRLRTNGTYDTFKITFKLMPDVS